MIKRIVSIVCAFSVCICFFLSYPVSVYASGDVFITEDNYQYYAQNEHMDEYSGLSFASKVAVQSYCQLNNYDFDKLPNDTGATGDTVLLKTLYDHGFIMPESLPYANLADTLYQKYIDYYSSGGVVTSGMNGLEFTPDAVEDLKGWAKAKLIPLDGYYLVEPNMTADALYNKFLPDDYATFADFMSKYPAYVYSRYTSTTHYVKAFISLSYFFYIDSDSVRQYNANSGGVNTRAPKMTLTTSHGCTVTEANLSLKPGDIDGFISSVPIKLFYSKTDLTRYLYGSRRIYISSNYYNPVTNNYYYNADSSSSSGGSSNNGYASFEEEVQKGTSEVMQNTGRDYVTETELQQIVDRIYEQMQNNNSGNGNGDDNGGGDNPSGGGDNPSGGGDVDLTETNSLLQKILNKLETIRNLIAMILIGQGIDNVTDLLDMSLDELGDYVANLGDIASGVADALTGVFPFSIPWDLMALLGTFSAEPKTPVFDLPFNIPRLNIEYTFHIDFSDYEVVSKISRAVLTCLFVAGLMHLTIKITKGGDDGGADE